MDSGEEEYLKDTDTAIECSREVHVLRPYADGMTWSSNSKNCYAEMGSSETSTTDSFGCLSCKTCPFGNLKFHCLQLDYNLYGFNFKIEQIIMTLVYSFQSMVAGGKSLH